MSAAVELLLGPDGVSVLDAAATAGDDDELRLTSRLRKRFPAELVAAAVEQTSLRRVARAKFGEDADRMLFTRAGLEQASGTRLATYRFGRLATFEAVADLCCGIGGDLLSLLGPGHSVLAVDRDAVHLRLADFNASVLHPSARFEPRNADVRDVPLDGLDAVFVDPARRDEHGGRRDVDGEPPIAWCAALAALVPAVVVKASPAVPHTSVPSGWEAEFVADGRDLKEATLWSPSVAGPARRATVLDDGAAHTLVDDGGGPAAVADVGAHLLDPNPAVTRAGLVETLARTVGATKIDEQIAFLTADRAVSTPFARTLPVLASAPWSERAVIGELRRLGAGAVEVRRRGLAGDVDALTRRLRRRLPADGTRRVLVAMTRHRDQPWAVICAV